MTTQQAIIAAKAAWQYIIRPLARARIALARKRTADSNQEISPRRARRTRSQSASPFVPFVLFVVLISSGCARFDPFWVWVGDVAQSIPEEPVTQSPQSPQSPDIQTNFPPSVPPCEPSSAWRSDLAQIPAVSNAVTFQTRNIITPPRSKPSGENEWMITRINGAGYERLLISTMSPSPDNPGRNPSRIMFMRPGRSDWFWDGRFSMPRPGPDTWTIDVHERCLRIRLNGAEIWRSEPGPWTVESATMLGYPGRGMLGEWSVP